MDVAALFWYVGAVVAGAGLSFVTIKIYSYIAQTHESQGYWSAVAGHSRALVYGDESEFWSHYKNVVGLTGKYVFRQLFAVTLAFAPVAFLLMLVAPVLLSEWARGAPVDVYPAGAGFLSDPAGAALPDDAARRVLTLASGKTIELEDAASGGIAVCDKGRFGCYALVSIGFSIVDPDSWSADIDQRVIIRANRNEWNPLWPYLSDPEFLMFLSLMVVSSALLLRRPKDESDEQRYEIGFVDDLLCQIAFGYKNAMLRVGDLETRIFRRKLQSIAITQPVFISGLARSGTTILLEKLSAIDGVATHRYRDFPFVFTPIFWNGFVRLFGKAQRPVERPHQDGIAINRDSPDAFEEPIWQHFFPHVHDPEKSHILGQGSTSQEFEDVFAMHLRKILLIRGGERYVSKGNYNLQRIGLLNQMFPDAMFLVPVRHPLMHIESLARQHRIFCDYSRNDPKVGDYMQTVGHYEFGPQRVPINVNQMGVESSRSAWDEGKDAIGYAYQWRDLYDYAITQFDRDDSLSTRIRIVRFEELCDCPESVLADLLEFVNLDRGVAIEDLAAGITEPNHKMKMSEELADTCWEIVREVAEKLGYTRTPGAAAKSMAS